MKISGVTPYFHKENSPHFTLYKGDCIDLLEKTPEHSVDLVFADPPYNLSNDGFSVHAGKRVSVNKGSWDKSEGPEKDFEFQRKWIRACKRILKPNGTIWISGTYHSIYQCGFALQLEGYHVLNDITWYKPNASPNLSCRMFTASHETLIWAKKDKKSKQVFNYTLMKEGDWSKDTMKTPKKQMRSVWSVNTPRNGEKKHGKHPTQKPMDLLERIILASTNEGDVVLDPFTGSSTTGIAAFTLKRKFVGFDKEKKYLELSKNRFADCAATLQLAL